MLLALFAGMIDLIDQPLLTALEVAWWGVAFSAALLVFINIQSYYNDPHRKEYEREWYEQFAAAQRRRYANSDIEWRMKDLNLHFGYQLLDRETRDEWRNSKMSIWPLGKRLPQPSDNED